ncbi:DUF2599 domain-containing protein [Nocardia uniformis]|uniref:DUF2599 domain-containing protein n=1 Tax=Nocardia uniformis TaxID=53432 RepID=A0A849BZN3_9NOCA|nr:DUF2599 domain-containing protein [Nocardia uniformis]NNH69107.1 DUF2599 domain-containing protein [Nocardia uniformis]
MRRCGIPAIGTAALLAALICSTGTAGATAPGSGHQLPKPVDTAPVSTLSSDEALDPFLDRPLIDHVVWTDGADGTRLMIYPTAAGRQDPFPPAAERAWQEVLRHADTADTPGMRDQFICHWDWARIAMPDKPSWNLEPWRPVVGYPATVAALCNPGAPEHEL